MNKYFHLIEDETLLANTTSTNYNIKTSYPPQEEGEDFVEEGKDFIVDNPNLFGQLQQQQQQQNISQQQQQQPSVQIVGTTTSSWGHEIDWIVVGCMIGLLIVLCIIFLALTIPPLLQWMKSKIPISPAKLERRYQTIEGWLITKKVRIHDLLCIHHEQNDEHQNSKSPIRLVKSIDTADTVRSSSSVCELDHDDDDDNNNNNGKEGIINDHNDYDEEEGIGGIEVGGGGCCYNSIVSSNNHNNECPICMDNIDIENTIVSWSPNVLCDHVFHHECIKEWLLHHDTCPCCRNQFLLVDNNPHDVLCCLQSSTSSTTLRQQHNNNHQHQPTSSSSIIRLSIPGGDGSQHSSITNTAVTQQEVNSTSTTDTSSWFQRSNYNNNASSSSNNNNNKKNQASSKHWTVDQLKVLAKQRSVRSNSTYYCIQHGLVTIPTTNKITKPIRKELTALNIQVHDLKKLRKSRITANTSSSDIDDNDIVHIVDATTNDIGIETISTPANSSYHHNNNIFNNINNNNNNNTSTITALQRQPPPPQQQCSIQRQDMILDYSSSIEILSSTTSTMIIPSVLSISGNMNDTVYNTTTTNTDDEE